MMMATTLTTFDVPLRLDAQGTIRVGQSRVTLDTVIGAFHQGASPEAIARQFPAVTLAELHRASATPASPGPSWTPPSGRGWRASRPAARTRRVSSR